MSSVEQERLVSPAFLIPTTLAESLGAAHDTLAAGEVALGKLMGHVGVSQD